MERQLHTLQILNILVEDILDIGSKTRETKVLPKKLEHAALDALSKLSIVQDRGVTSLKSLLDSARDQKSSLDDYLNLCRSEPVFLAHMVNLWFFTRPELVQDERGRILPLITDKYISIVVFEMIHNAVTGAAIWDYICRLLQILGDRPNELVSQTFILPRAFKCLPLGVRPCAEGLQTQCSNSLGIKVLQTSLGKSVV